MQRVARIFGSITFRLALIYTLVFGMSVGALFAFIFYMTSGFAEQQIEVAIDADISGFRESYNRAGITGLALAINRRTDPSSPSYSRDGIYLLLDPVGRAISGNLQSWPQKMQADDLWLNFTIKDMRGATPATADVRAKHYQPQGMDPGEYQLLVGRDVRDARVFRELLLDSLNIGLAITLAFGLLGGFIFSRVVMRRIEAITRTCRRIMSGDLSQRVPVSRGNDELGQLSDSINAMLDQIERLMKGMQQVSDNVAHDLRTPLTRLRSRLESALRRINDPAQREAIEGALIDADSLLATFAALLRIARAEAGLQRNSVEVDLHALAAEVADLYGALAEEKGLNFVTQLQEGIKVQGDPNLIGQALANLVDNAIKYTDQGAVTIALAQQDGHPLLIVSDTGPGVPDEYKGKVLERLFRLEQSRTSVGSGLGLSLVSAVAKSHGLELKLEDNFPGLRVTLRFPKPLPASAALPAGAKQKSLPAPEVSPLPPEAEAA